jgi:hypothetical protein
MRLPWGSFFDADLRAFSNLVCPSPARKRQGSLLQNLRPFTTTAAGCPWLLATGRNAAFLVWGRSGRGYFINSRLLTTPVKSGTLVL